MQTTAVSVQSLITEVGTVFTTAIDWVGDVAQTISTEPVLILMCIGIPLVGLGVGLFGRLLHS